MWSTISRLFAKSKSTEEGEEAAEEEAVDEEETNRRYKKKRDCKNKSKRSSTAALSASRECYENGEPVADVAAVHVFVSMERNMGDDRRKGNAGAHGDQQIGAAGDAEHFSDAYDTRLVSPNSVFFKSSSYVLKTIFWMKRLTWKPRRNVVIIASWR